MKYLSFFLAFPLLLMTQGCGGSSENNPGNSRSGNSSDDAVSVEIVEAVEKDISQQIKSFGNIRAKEIVNVVPQVSNRVTQINAELGDTVRPGDVLAKIYEVPFRDQFQQAKAQLEQNRAAYIRDSLQFKRQKELFKQDLISSTEYDNAQASFQSSRAQLQASRANLTQSREDLMNTDITSPVFGVVLSRNISVGDLASSGQTAYQLANLTGLQCRVYLPLEEWRSVEIGQSVDFRVSNQPEIKGKGRVSHISPRIDPTTGLGEVVISLTDRGSSIYQGMLVESVIHVETHENAVVIPRAALVENVQTMIEPESNSIRLERSYSTFVIQDDSLALKRELELGIQQGDQIEVLKGLKAGDQIVITGQNNLQDSTKVRISSRDTFDRSPQIPIESSSGNAESTEPSDN